MRILAMAQHDPIADSLNKVKRHSHDGVLRRLTSPRQTGHASYEAVAHADRARLLRPWQSGP